MNVVSPGRARRSEASSSVASYAAHMDAPCVLAPQAAIAPESTNVIESEPLRCGGP